MTDLLQSALVEYLESHSDMSMKDLLSEIKIIIKDVKDDQKKQKKSSSKSGEPKPLNPYQSFVKEQMRIFKENGTTLTGKELMREISLLWKQQKDSPNDPEPVTPPESPVSDVETKSKTNVKVDEQKGTKGGAKGNGSKGSVGGFAGRGGTKK